MRQFFYIRVSGNDQPIERQLVEARKLGIEDPYIFIETASGKDFKRPEYQLMKRMLRPGDSLFLHSLDRLGRNKQMILDEWKELTQARKVEVIVLDMPLLDTRKHKQMTGIEGLIADIIIQLLSYMAEDERKRINLRQQEGIAAAIKNGVKFGRKPIKLPDNFEAVYQDWKNHKITAVQAMKLTGLKNNTFYRRAKEYEKHDAN